MAFQKSDGINYAPVGKARAVVKHGEFVFAATALDHGHIYGMCNGLIEAGAVLKKVYDPDEKMMKSISLEIEQNLRRIRHHASIALLCGNNEIEWHFHEYVAISGRTALKKACRGVQPRSFAASGREGSICRSLGNTCRIT